MSGLFLHHGMHTFAGGGGGPQGSQYSSVPHAMRPPSYPCTTKALPSTSSEVPPVTADSFPSALPLVEET